MQCLYKVTLIFKIISGGSNINQNFISSPIQKLDESLNDKYFARLNFTMVPELAGKPCSLEVANDLGETIYPFQLEMYFQPGEVFSIVYEKRDYNPSILKY